MTDSGKNPRQTFVEMEDRLLSDKLGTYKKELVNKLLDHESKVNAMIHDAAHDNELFERLNQLKTAIRSAKQTVEKF